MVLIVVWTSMIVWTRRPSGEATANSGLGLSARGIAGPATRRPDGPIQSTRSPVQEQADPWRAAHLRSSTKAHGRRSSLCSRPAVQQAHTAQGGGAAGLFLQRLSHAATHALPLCCAVLPRFAFHTAIAGGLGLRGASHPLLRARGHTHTMTCLRLTPTRGPTRSLN